jgi:long-subunit fatty acid transport protein
MKLKQLIILTVVIFFSNHTFAQDASPSPYSFFGIGNSDFKGMVENISMGGINMYTDSIHYNINNPASLTNLKYINLNLGMNNHFVDISDANSSSQLSSHNVTYFSLAIPIGKKIGVGFGILPLTSAGYKIYSKQDNGDVYTYESDGGLSRLFLAGAYKLTDALSIGAEYQYYFGYIDHENKWLLKDITTYTKERGVLSMKGSSFKVAADYKLDFNKKNYLKFNTFYRLQSNLQGNYAEKTGLFTVSSSGEELVENLDKEDASENITLPSTIGFGFGLGAKNKSFIGAEYNYLGMKNFRNVFYDPSYVQYKDGYQFKLGGMYTPEYNSITKYWKRITYRAGMRIENTGMNVYGEDITDFGITFGVGLPSIRALSNLNIGFELGQRGKATEKLVKENYFNLHISLSLNDRWFIKRKIN